MTDDVPQLQIEIKELERLLQLTQIPGVRAKISKIIEVTEKDIESKLKQRELEPADANQTETINADAVSETVLIDDVPKKESRTSPEVLSFGSQRFESIGTFAWDQGSYNSEWVTVYVTLPGVGTVKDNVTCRFDKNLFDLQVHSLEGKDYRLLKDNLDKEISPNESKFTVKKDKVVVKLKKVKGKYGPEHWENLTAKRPKKDKDVSNDPTAGIMDLMKDMYEQGDDNMRKIIGESMLKSRRGEKVDPSFDA